MYNFFSKLLIDKFSKQTEKSLTTGNKKSRAKTPRSGKVENKKIFSLLPQPPNKILIPSSVKTKKQKQIHKKSFVENWEKKLNPDQRNAWNKLPNAAKYSYLFSNNIKTKGQSRTSFKRMLRKKVKKNSNGVEYKKWWKDNPTDWDVT